MIRPYILSHSDKWFVFLGCSLIALCTNKDDALAVQREWIRRGQEWDPSEDTLLVATLLERAPIVVENGNA
jgi:hypothetical protein